MTARSSCWASSIAAAWALIKRCGGAGAATNRLPADTALVRQYRSRAGGSLNLEQGLTDDLGFFLRASLNDGSQETYEFTDMNQSLSTGLSLKGTGWDRKDDTVGPGV